MQTPITEGLPQLSKTLRVLPVGTKLYVARPEFLINKPTMYFLDPSRAIMWAVLTDPQLLPEFYEGQEMDDMFSVYPSKAVPGYIIPKPDEYPLMEFTVTGTLKYFDGFASGEEYDTLAAKGSKPSGLYTLTLPSYANDSKIYKVNSEGFDINRTYMRLDEAKQEVLFEGNKATDMVDTTVLRIHNLDVIELLKNYGINWDMVWEYLSQAKYDGADLERLKVYFHELIADPVSRDKIIVQVTGDDDDCLADMFGFRNRDNSCFLDSTLMAMFVIKDSPFYDNLIVRDLTEQDVTAGLPVCDEEDPELDYAQRRNIQKSLRSELNQAMSGEQIICTNIRLTLGKHCKPEDPTGSFSKGQHDPSELYSRLVGALAYSPMTITQTTMRASGQFGSEAYVSSEVTVKSDMLTFNARDPTNIQEGRISYPDSWEPPFENIGSGDKFTWMRTSTRIESADVVVIQVDRRDISAEQAAPLQGFGQALVPAERRVLATRFRINNRMFVGGQQYFLRSAVYSPHDGHWATLINCGGQWLNYDDTNIAQFISKNKVAGQKAIELIETRGVLLFFYKVKSMNTEEQGDKLAATMSQSASQTITTYDARARR